MIITVFTDIALFTTNPATFRNLSREAIFTTQHTKQPSIKNKH